MAYTREEIQKMPINRLRLLDISDPADETLIQELIKEKLAQQAIVGTPARSRPHATDNLTPETEAVLQEKIDASNAKNKAQVLGEDVVTEEPVEAPLEHPAAQESEADIEANLAQLEAERAALVEAEKEPFVPEEAPVVEPEVEEEPEAKKTKKRK